MEVGAPHVEVFVGVRMEQSGPDHVDDQPHSRHGHHEWPVNRLWGTEASYGPPDTIHPLMRRSVAPFTSAASISIRTYPNVRSALGGCSARRIAIRESASAPTLGLMRMGAALAE